VGTKTRVPNQAGWALDEILDEHDPEINELLAVLIDQVQREKEAAENRFDTRGRLRIAEVGFTLMQLQYHLGRVQKLHRMARANEYDRR